MKQPARTRESGQRPTREELVPASGYGRMAEIGALAAAASAVAIGALDAKERLAARDDAADNRAVPDIAHEAGGGLDLARHDSPSHAPDLQTTAARLVELGDGSAPTEHAAAAETVFDPSALTARIAEQIASSVSHVLDMAAGGQGTAQTLSHDIVEQAQSIAQEVHSQFMAHEPLAALADLLPASIGLEALGSSIIESVDRSLAESGVMDLLQGATAIADPDVIIGGIVANLNGLELPIDVSAFGAMPTGIADAVPADLLGGVAHGQNPLADLFYDDGGADVVKSAVDAVGKTLGDAVTEMPKIGFLAQPIDLGDELGGLTHGNGGLHLL